MKYFYFMYMAWKIKQKTPSLCYQSMTERFLGSCSYNVLLAWAILSQVLPFFQFSVLLVELLQVEKKQASRHLFHSWQQCPSLGFIWIIRTMLSKLTRSCSPSEYYLWDTQDWSWATAISQMKTSIRNFDHELSVQM